MMKAKIFDDILGVFLITYAAAALSFEKYVPEGIINFLGAIYFIAFAAVWMWLSYKNGRKKSIVFPVFTAVFWLLPHLIIYLSNSGSEVFRMSVIMYVLSEFSDLIAIVPIKITGNIAGISAYGAAAVILLLCGASYFFGRFTAEE